MTLQPHLHTLSRWLRFNTASLALFRLLTAAAILWHLCAHHNLLLTLILLLPVMALGLGYRTRLIAMGLLVIALLFIVADWGTPSVYDLWMALLCSWCASLPVNAQWGVDAALQKPLKDEPNLRLKPNSSQAIMPRTYTLSSWLIVLIGVLVLAATLQTMFFNSIGISLFNVAALSVLIPASLWQKLISALKTTPRYQNIQQLVIHYDADCGFCLKMCLVLREFLLTRETKIITAQSDEKIFPIMEANNSWVVQSANGDTHIHWHAMHHLFNQRLPFKLMAWLMNMPPLMRAGNKVYAWVAENRNTMSRMTAVGLPWVTIPRTPTPFHSVCVATLSIALTALLFRAAVL